MEGYGLGKDIQMILTRLEKVEAMLASQRRDRSSCKCKRYKTVSLVAREAVADERGRSKYAHFGRLDDAECECQEQSITIWEDGHYEYTSSQYNHSQFPDDGDDHVMTILIKSDDEILHTFSCKKFVPNYETRILEDSGDSGRLHDRYDDINKVSFHIDCD